MSALARCLTILTMLLFVSQSVQARPLTKEEKIRDFEQLVTTMRAGYGPLEYKKATQGIDIRRLEARYIAKILRTKTNAEYYFAVSAFVASFNDSHFSAQIPSNYRGSLGMMTDLVEGKVILINTDKFPEIQEEGLTDGDEIVSFGGKPVMEVVNHLASYVGMGYEKTSKRMATWMLTSRSESRLPVPTGAQKIVIRKLQSREVIEINLDWKHSGTPAAEEDRIVESINPMHDYGLSLEPTLKSLGLDKIGPTFMCSPGTRTPVPEGAQMIMDKPFVAYTHATPQGNVGYLRIPHYMPTGPSGQPEFELRLAQYQYAVKILEEKTVGLVIDQGHNCGGSVGYLAELVGLFIDEEVPGMPFEMLGSKASLMQMESYLRQTPPFTLEHQVISNLYLAVKEAWEKGTFLSSKTTFTGPIRPSNVVQYTKPVLMLIDEMSGSGGDAFPALLGGIGRATLFGERTMGAGGHVTSEPSLAYSGIAINMTKSLFYRPDGVAVENNGAVPHIPYEITANDAVNGFVEYQKAYLKALSELIAQSSLVLSK